MAYKVNPITGKLDYYESGGGGGGSLTIGDEVVDGTPGSVLFIDDDNNLGQDDTFFYDQPNGRLGLGTASPDNQLHLYGPGTLIKLEGLGDGTTAIDFVPGGSNHAYQFGAASGGFAIYDLTSSAYRMAVTSGGKVGFGITTPAAELVVADPASGNGLEIDTASSSGLVYLQAYARSGSTGFKKMYLDGTELRIRPGANDTKVLTLTTTGIGISTTSPAARLEVHQNSTDNPDLFAIHNNSSRGGDAKVFYIDKNGSVTFQNGNGINWFNIDLGGSITSLTSYGDDSAWHNLDIRALDTVFKTANTEVMRTTTDARVGILTSSPTAKLDINSDVLRLRTPKTPASSGASGNQGDIAWDSDYIYIAIATNTWQRVAHATW